MAIQVITNDTEIVKGKWVCGATNIHFGLCSAPRQVDRVVGSRIYLVPSEGKVGSFISRKSAQFVCDTKEEGDELGKMSFENYRAVNASITAITDATKARMMAFIEASK